jgi:hypothetical protein
MRPGADARAADLLALANDDEVADRAACPLLFDEGTGFRCQRGESTWINRRSAQVPRHPGHLSSPQS